MIHQDPAIRQAGVYPGMIAITGQCDLIARFSSNLADHHMVPLATRIPSVPNRTIASVPGPGLVKIRFLGIGNLMKTGTIGIDDTDSRLPIPDLRGRYLPTKEYQFVSGL